MGLQLEKSEVTFLQNLERRNEELFIEANEIITSVRKRLARIKTERGAKKVLLEATGRKDELIRKHGSKQNLAYSDIQKIDSIILGLVHRTIDRIRAASTSSDT